MKFKLLALVVIGILPMELFSQAQISIHGIYTMPMSKFGESNYKNGVGGGMQFFTGSVLPSDYPFKLRLGFGVNGSNSQRKKFSFETEDPPGGLADYIVKNNNNAAYWAVRLEKTEGKFGIFGDLLYGTRNLHSLEKISLSQVPRNYNKEDYEKHAHRITESKRVFWGLGLGVNYYLTNNAIVDVYANYTASKSFTYLDHATLEVDPLRGQLKYKYATAENSNVLTLHIGVKFNLVGILNSSKNESNSTPPPASSKSSTSTGTNSPKETPSGKVRNKPKKEIKIKKKGGAGTG